MATFFPHHLGHYLGLDTHDTMVVERNQQLERGVTVQPGVYVPLDYYQESMSLWTITYVDLLQLESEWYRNPHLLRITVGLELPSSVPFSPAASVY